MPQGYESLYDPGDTVTVTLVADASGNVASEGDLLEITGQNSEHAELAVVATAGGAVAMLTRMPDDYDSSTSYSAGQVVGEAEVLLREAVDWVTPTTAGSVAPGDQVVSDVGGTVRAYDSAGGDTADMLLGRVWTTFARGKYQSDKVAIVRT